MIPPATGTPRHGVMELLASAHHVTTGAQTVSAGALLLQLVIGLGVVLGVIAVASKILRGRASTSRFLSRQSNPLTVLARQTLGKGVALAVVRVGDRAFVVGVSQGGVRPVAEVDPDVIYGTEQEKPPPAPLSLLRRLDKTSSIVGGDKEIVPSAENRGRLPVPTWTSAIEHLRERTVRRA